MSHVCPLATRAPFSFCRLSAALNVAQRQRYHGTPLVRLVLAFNSPIACPSTDTPSRQSNFTQFRNFSSSFPPQARNSPRNIGKATARSERPGLRKWQHYKPDVGIPLESGHLDQSTIQSIFGPAVDEHHGNHVLRLINYRRISGSLIDVGLVFPDTMQISHDQAEKALAYLRDQDPAFDEQLAGAAWAEAEVERVEQEYMTRAEKLGIYKKTVGDDTQKNTAYQDVYGESALAALRRENKARWMEEDRKKKEMKERERVEKLTKKRTFIPHNKGASSQEQYQNDTGSDDKSSNSLTLDKPVGKAWLEPVERKPWVQYYEEQATIIKDSKVPDMSILRRLGPATLLTLAVVGACIALHEMYTPPPKSARMFPDIPPAIATLGTIVAINIAVFVAWRIPPLWRTMNKYFLVTPGYPYAIGVFMAQFSHQTPWHLLSNFAFFLPFGLMLHDDVGRGTFLAICLGTGTFGAYGALVFNVLLRRWQYYVFGASTAVWGVVAAACLARSEQHATILGHELPLTGMAVLGFLGGLEILAAWRGRRVGIDYAGHLCGMTSGTLAALLIRHQAAQREMMRTNHITDSPLTIEKSS